MIDVSIKTLDGQTRNYSIPEDEVLADTQRLIFQGRVLQDSKLLKDYDVHGKVIHVVQRPPPSSRPNLVGSETPPATASMTRDINSFVLGSFTLPSETLDPNQVQNIVQQAVSAMGELGRNARVSARTSSDGSAVDVHINLGQIPVAQVTDAQQRLNQIQKMMQMLKQTLDKLDNPDSSTSTSQEADEASAQAASQSAADDERMEQNAEPCTASQQATDQQGDSSQQMSGQPNQTQAASLPPVSSLANILDELRELTQRLQPHLDWYHMLMRNDRSFKGEAETTQKTSRMCGLVSEALHHLSHVYHNISDLTTDLAQAPPRRLRASTNAPTMQQAFIQQAIPVQPGQINLGNSRVVTHNVGVPVNQTSRATTQASQVSSSETSSTASVSTSQSPSNTNPYLFLEVGPESLTLNSISAHVVSTVENDSTPINLTGIPPRQAPQTSAPTSVSPGSVTSAPTTAVHTGGLVFSSSNSNGSLSTTTSSATGGRPRGTTILLPGGLPNLPGLVSSHADPFLLCSSRHFSGNQARNGSGQPVPGSDRALADVVSAVMSGLLGNSAAMQPQPDLATAPSSQSATQVPRPATVNSSETAAPQTGSAAMPNPLFSFLSSNVPTGTTEQRAERGTEPSFVNALRNMLQTAPRPESAASNSTSQSQTSANAEQNSPLTDETFAQLVQGVGNYVTQAALGQQIHDTISDFLNTLGESYNIVQSEGFINDVFQCVARHFTFPDMMTVFFGSPEPLNRLRVPLQDLVVDRILHGEEAKENNLKKAVDKLVDDMQDEVKAALEGVEVQPNIDAIATLNNFLKQQLLGMITYIVQAEDVASYGQGLYQRCRQFLSELIVLSKHSLVRGLPAFEQLMHQQLRNLTTGVNPRIQQWMINMTSQQLNSYLPHVTVRDEDICHYIVWKTDSSDQAAGQQQEEAASEMEVVCETNSLPVVAEAASAVPKSDTKAAGEGSPIVNNSETKAAVNDAVPSFGVRTNAVAMASSDEIDDWCNVIPAEWVPIIRRDIQQQRRQNSQPPFSDGYLNGMPAKRRKMMNHNKPCNLSEVSEYVPESLKKAVVSAGVEPVSSFDNLSREAGEDLALHSAFEQHITSSIAHRLQTDSDYNPENFPNSKEYFKKQQKNGS